MYVGRYLLEAPSIVRADEGSGKLPSFSGLNGPKTIHQIVHQHYGAEVYRISVVSFHTSIGAVWSTSRSVSQIHFLPDAMFGGQRAHEKFLQDREQIKLPVAFCPHSSWGMALTLLLLLADCSAWNQLI